MPSCGAAFRPQPVFDRRTGVYSDAADALFRVPADRRGAARGVDVDVDSAAGVWLRDPGREHSRAISPALLFCLMSVHFGLRARRSGTCVGRLACRIGRRADDRDKLSNLPLLLPCLVAAWPSLAQLRKHLAGSAAVAAHRGAGVGRPDGRVTRPTPAAGTATRKIWRGLGRKLRAWRCSAAAFWSLQQSLMPPVLPAAQNVSEWLDQLLPASWRHLDGKIPKVLSDSPQRTAAGRAAALGLGVTLLLLLAVGAAVCGLGRAGANRSMMAAVSPWSVWRRGERRSSSWSKWVRRPTRD